MNAIASPLAAASRADLVLRRLDAHHPLAEARSDAVAALAASPTRHPAGAQLYAEGEIGARPAFVVKGWAACQRILRDGRRQVIRLVVPGDIIGLEAGRGPPAWSVAALTPLETLCAGPVLEAAGRGASRLTRALAFGVRQEERLMIDQLVRIGRFTGQERMAHLLLELRDRLAVVGLGDARRFPLPLTQEAIADTLGLSAIHVNRILKGLRQDGLIEIRAGMITLLDYAALAELAGRPAPAPRIPAAADALMAATV